MAYCTITDVQALNPKRTYGVSTTPTTTQVGLFITNVAAEIDMILLGRGLSVPVSSPAALVAALLAVNAYGAAAQAEMAMFPESVDKGSTPHWNVLEEKYQGWMTILKEGDLAQLQGDLVGSLYTNSGTDQDEYHAPSFTNSQVF